jgi:hypothetical protein
MDWPYCRIPSNSPSLSRSLSAFIYPPFFLLYSLRKWLKSTNQINAKGAAYSLHNSTWKLSDVVRSCASDRMRAEVRPRKFKDNCDLASLRR